LGCALTAVVVAVHWARARAAEPDVTPPQVDDFTPVRINDSPRFSTRSEDSVPAGPDRSAAAALQGSTSSGIGALAAAASGMLLAGGYWVGTTAGLGDSTVYGGVFGAALVAVGATTSASALNALSPFAAVRGLQKTQHGRVLTSTDVDCQYWLRDRAAQ
jgi:hypothetical protein